MTIPQHIRPDPQTGSFSIPCRFEDETRETEIMFLVNGENILQFQRFGKRFTTKWNLDDAVFWLRDFAASMKHDPYPVSARGKFAAQKDICAREFDADDAAEFDQYYDRLDQWNLRHRWHPYSNGAVMADLYFELVDDNVEISWNNLDAENDVIFLHQLGGVRIPKDQFLDAVSGFVRRYMEHWFQSDEKTKK